MATAYVLINCELGSEESIISQLKNLEGVIEVHGTFGAYDILVKIESGLYGASEEELLNFLLFIDDDISSVGLVGHEPGLKQLAIYLAGAYGKGLENVLNKHFSTSSAIVLVLNVKRWDQINERAGVISHYYDSLNA